MRRANSQSRVAIVAALAVVGSWAMAFMAGRWSGGALAPEPMEASAVKVAMSAPVARVAPVRVAPQPVERSEEVERAAVEEPVSFAEEMEPEAVPSREAVSEMLAALDEVHGQGLLGLRLEQAAAGLGVDEIADAVDALAQLPPGPKRQRGLLAVVNRWAQLAPQDALAYAEDELVPALRQRMVQTAMAGWAQRDPVAALAEVEANPSWGYAGVAAHAVFQSVSGLPSGEAFQFLEGVDQEKYAALTSQAVARMVELDVDAVMGWTSGLPAGTLRAKSMYQVIGELAQYDPVKALEWVEEVEPDGNVETAQYGRIAGMWALHDPEGARDWYLSLSAEDVGSGTGKQLFDSWLRVDSSAASEWLDAADPDPKLDQGFVAYARRLQRREPDRALDVTTQITDEQARQGVQQQLVNDWARRDAARTLERIRESPLSPAEQEPLVALAQRRLESNSRRESSRRR